MSDSQRFVQNRDQTIAPDTRQRMPARERGGELPAPSDEALAHSRRLIEHLRDSISHSGGWLPFSRYMNLALYAPGLGYYSAGARKLGGDGDFVTAPELSPLFGQTLAHQVADLFTSVPRHLLEIGAGSGALAASLLTRLEELDALPERYLMLEVSADLRGRCRDTLAARVPHLLERVVWLDRLPDIFSGVVLGNEVLDAMPADVFHVGDDSVEEAGVVMAGDGFTWAWRAASPSLAAAVTPLSLPSGYVSEVSLAARAWVAGIGAWLVHGAILFIDYGFPRREYYHPQRNEGTLMCHYRHRAHADPFFLPGLQDITAHVDFTAMADAALAAGLRVLGYTTQGQFLINGGITDLLAERLPVGGAADIGYLAASNAAQRLLSPAEMGELFKVLALGKGELPPLRGFTRGDRTHTL